MPEDVRLHLLALALGGVLLGVFLLQWTHRMAHAAPAAAPHATAAPAAQLGPPNAEEALIGRVATAVAARPVRVSCSLESRLGGDLTELGEAQTVPGSSTAGVVLLAPSICSNLLAFAHGLVASDWACVQQNATGLCSGAVDADVLALHTLAHESWHVRGIRDEATADCYALQTVSKVAQTLGADAVDAQALAVYYTAHFDAIRRPPTAYRSSECRDGGALDLNPGPGGWPS
jgi:hypothetical protein